MRLKRTLRSLWFHALALIEVTLANLPNLRGFSTMRIWYWRVRGYAFSKSCFIARNVFFLGKVSIGEGSHVANNCYFNASTSEISIGAKVMIAPNCVFVAFDHGYRRTDIPMIDQPYETAPVRIEDDVWIGANCTITKGVKLGKGCIVSANSLVRVDVQPYCAVRGVPARVIGSRQE